ncbi:hypothetical protein LTR43_012199, partial [Exophiala xenobiotica]
MADGIKSENTESKTGNSVNTETQKEFVDAVQLPHAHLDRDEINLLSPEHREYLLARHGTLDLDPMPDMGD